MTIYAYVTNPMHRALRKLKSEWQTQDQIDERASTLDALVDRKLANRSRKDADDRLYSEQIWRISPLGVQKLEQLAAKKKKPRPAV